MTARRRVPVLLGMLDFVCVVAVFNLTAWLRGVPGAGEITLAPLIGPFAVLFLAIFLIDGYSPRADMMSLTYTSQHIIALLAGMVAMLLVTFVFIKDSYALQSSRGVIALSYLVLIPLTLSYRRISHRRSLRRLARRSLVFLGSQASCVSFREQAEQNHLTQEVLYVATDMASHESTAPMLGIEMHALDELPPLLDRPGERIEAVILHFTGRDLPFALSEKLIGLHFAGTPTFTLELFAEVYWRKTHLDRLDQTWLFEEGFRVARDPVFERLKRLSDIVLAALGLVVYSPFLLLCAVAIRLGDKGPVFYRQKRIGHNRVPFQILKFRTMRPDAEKSGPYTRDHDDRITRVGHLLRAMRLDELPQLWNVLRGEMSLIGPRAESAMLVERYEKAIPCYHFRHLVKPGITGWAQVNYPYGESLDDTLRKLEYDLYYIRHFSFTLDASIVLKTIHIMLFGKGR